jgi:hypothetical protein
MPNRKTSDAPQISLFARVDSFDVRSSLGFNVFLLGTRRDYIEGDTEVFESTTQLIIRGVFYESKERSADGGGDSTASCSRPRQLGHARRRGQISIRPMSGVIGC